MNLPRKPPRRRYTVEQFMRSSLTEAYRYELVNGRLFIRPVLWAHEGLILSNLIGPLSLFWQNHAGLVQFLLPVCHQLQIPEATGDNVRLPDLTIITKDKLDTLDSGPVKFAPDIAIELNLKEYDADYLPNKLVDYQKAGWNVIWLLNPVYTKKDITGTVEIYKLQEETGLQPAQILNQTDTLVGEGILEGFTMPVKEIFV